MSAEYKLLITSRCNDRCGIREDEMPRWLDDFARAMDIAYPLFFLRRHMTPPPVCIGYIDFPLDGDPCPVSGKGRKTPKRGPKE